MDLQTIIAQGPNVSLTLTDEKLRELVNYHLNNELDEPVLSPESGIQKIRKVLARFRIEIPALYDSDPEGDEVIIDLEENYHLYFIYYLTEDDFYEFYAEIVNDEELDEIISDEEEDEEEE